ncbi:bifunctional 4-hydroxy-2-oxoglutarate aldolase/2-dehydro-3-deoxy-phosphogluconate aldolase [Klebsiella pneumoniae]
MKNWKTTAEAILTSGPVVPVIVVKKAGTRGTDGSAGGGRRSRAGSYPAHRVRPEAIRAIAKEVPDAIVGAGTVTNVEQLKAVTEAGAQFAISPGLTESLLKAATEDGTIPLIPGISTVSELMLGMQYGLKEFKFFPAEANGGVKALQAIAGPFGHIRFCPTGGISPANYRDYLALNSVLCIGGSWLVPADALEAGDYDRITTLAREAVEGAK